MKLEFPEKKHEKEYLEMIQEFTDNKEVIIPWAANLKEGETYDDFLVRIKRDMETGNPKYDFAKSSLYFLIDDKEKIVWIEAIRPISAKHWDTMEGILDTVLDQVKEEKDMQQFDSP